MQLRPYQSQLLQSLRESFRSGNTRTIAVLPTGGGKTFTFSFLVRSAINKGRKCLIVTDRIELMTQAGGALRSLDLNPIRVEAGKKPPLGGQLYTGMVETIMRRVGSRKDYGHWLRSMDIVIIDECHKRSFTKLISELREDCKVIGFTATPERVGKKDQLGESYTDLVVGVEIEYLINNGYLAKPNYYGVKADLSGVTTKRGDYDQNDVANRFSTTKLYKGVVENWKEKTPNTKTLVFSSNIESSKELLSEFLSNGYDAKHLDATMSDTDRTEILQWFNTTPKAILLNVGILTTGFDEPSVETIILYRATKSLPLYLQMVGRGSRVAHGKTEFNILDFGNNILTHGFWHIKREWDISIRSGSNSPIGEQVMKNCPNCGCFIPSRAVICNECGFEDVKERKQQEFARLQKLDPKTLWKETRSESLEKQVEMSKRKLLNPYRVLHDLKDFKDVQKFIKLMGWNPYWYEHNHERFWWSSEYKQLRDSGKIAVRV